MSDTQALLHRLASEAGARRDGMPTQREPVQLHVGELNLIIRALILLDAVRSATKQ